MYVNWNNKDSLFACGAFVATNNEAANYYYEVTNH